MVASAALLAVVLMMCCAHAIPMKPTKVYLTAMERALDAEEALLVCRAANFTERLKDLECFKTALNAFAYNATWAKQAGALFVMTAQRKQAYKHFNHSYNTILEAQGIINNVKIPRSIPPASWLKLYSTREKAGSLELAKVWFQSLQMEHRTTEARKLIDEFIEPLEDYSESTDLFRIVGSVVDVVKVKQEWRKWKEEERKKKGKKTSSSHTKESTVNVVAEELLRMSEELSNRWLSAPLTISATGLEESQEFSRATCGVGFQFKDSYQITELTHYLGVCVAKWGDLRKHVTEEGPPMPYGALLRTPLHALAGYATEYVVRVLVEAYPQLVKVVDNFGSTPLHMAAATGNLRAMKTMLKADGAGIADLKQSDAGGFSPLKLACSNTFVRSAMEELMLTMYNEKGACGPHTLRETFADATTEEDDDDDSSIVVGGGWKDAIHRDEPECGFDVRNGNSMSHHELVGRYLHSSRPIVLRGVIPVSVRRSLQRKHFLPQYHDLWVRHEEYPAAELYGGKLLNITTILSWSKHSNGTFASIEVDKRHALSKLLHWLPEKLVPKKEGYTTTDDSWPLLVLAGKGATTNFAYRSAHYAHAVVYGVQHWTVVSPVSARSTRQKMRLQESEKNAIKCTLHSGDVLVLPAQWAAAYWSVGESIGFSRRFIWK